MAFQKKNSKGSSLDFYNSQKTTPITTSAGVSPVNPDGSLYDNSIKLNWPFQQFTTDNVGNPQSNNGKPTRLSQTETALTDFKKGR